MRSDVLAGGTGLKIRKDSVFYREIFYSAAAVLLLAVLWCATFWCRRDETGSIDAKIVILGDSLVGQCRDETSVTACLSEALGRQVFNGAMGGTRMVSGKGFFKGNYSMELLNMVDLSKAVAAKDFRAQKTAHYRYPMTEYFRDNIDDLACIDFDSTEILLLEYGLNDYHSAVPIENEDSPQDEGTFAGAIRDVVNTLRDVYPGMRIVMVTPTYAWYVDQGLTCEEYDTGNGCLERYVDAQIRAAAELGIEVIDLYHGLYSHDNWENWAVYTEDGVHPNENGRRMIAEFIAEEL